MNEKIYFSKKRFEQLHYPRNLDNGQNDFDKKIEAERKFGNILLTPLDIPVIKDSDFVNWYWSNSKKINKIIPDIATERNDLESFVSIDYVHKNSNWILERNNVWSLNSYSNLETLFPNLFDQIHEYFPFKTIESFSVWSSTEPIGLHRDKSVFLDIPASFRIMIYDDNPSPTLHVEEFSADSSTPEPNSGRYVPRLDDTNSFVWSNLRTKHGSFYNPGYRKILLIFTHVVIDWKKYCDLIDRSISKYKNQCLTSKLSITDFVYPTITGFKT